MSNGQLLQQENISPVTSSRREISEVEVENETSLDNSVGVIVPFIQKSLVRMVEEGRMLGRLFTKNEGGKK